MSLCRRSGSKSPETQPVVGCVRLAVNQGVSEADNVGLVDQRFGFAGMPADETLGIIKDLRVRAIVMLREGLQES
jgi:hypothetical protein